MTKYDVWSVDREDSQTLSFVGTTEARSPRAALAAVVKDVKDGAAFAVIPVRNFTVLTAKTKPAQVSWS